MLFKRLASEVDSSSQYSRHSLVSVCINIHTAFTHTIFTTSQSHTTDTGRLQIRQEDASTKKGNTYLADELIWSSYSEGCGLGQIKNNLLPVIASGQLGCQHTSHDWSGELWSSLTVAETSIKARAEMRAEMQYMRCRWYHRRYSSCNGNVTEALVVAVWPAGRPGAPRPDAPW